MNQPPCIGIVDSEEHGMNILYASEPVYKNKNNPDYNEQAIYNLFEKVADKKWVENTLKSYRLVLDTKEFGEIELGFLCSAEKTNNRLTLNFPRLEISVVDGLNVQSMSVIDDTGRLIASQPTTLSGKYEQKVRFSFVFEEVAK